MFKLKVDTSVLPLDCSSFTDDKFYGLVNQLAGSTVAKILKTQAINSISTFLLTREPLALLFLRSKAMDTLRREACFVLDDNSYEIQAGVKSSVAYLTELFRKKNGEHSKSRTNKQSTSSFATSAVLISSLPRDESSIDVSSSLNDQLQEQVLTIPEHIESVKTTISKWTKAKTAELGLIDVLVEEGKQYKLSITSIDTGTIRCQCDTNIVLRRMQEPRFQLWNYYKHLQTKKCGLLWIKEASVPSLVTSDEQVADEEESVVVHDQLTYSTRSSKRVLSIESQPLSTEARSKRRRV